MYIPNPDFILMLDEKEMNQFPYSKPSSSPVSVKFFKSIRF